MYPVSFLAHRSPSSPDAQPLTAPAPSVPQNVAPASPQAGLSDSLKQPAQRGKWPNVLPAKVPKQPSKRPLSPPPQMSSADQGHPLRPLRFHPSHLQLANDAAAQHTPPPTGTEQNSLAAEPALKHEVFTDDGWVFRESDIDFLMQDLGYTYQLAFNHRRPELPQNVQPLDPNRVAQVTELQAQGYATNRNAQAYPEVQANPVMPTRGANTLSSPLPADDSWNFTQDGLESLLQDLGYKNDDMPDPHPFLENCHQP